MSKRPATRCSTHGLVVDCRWLRRPLLLLDSGLATWSKCLLMLGLRLIRGRSHRLEWLIWLLAKLSLWLAVLRLPLAELRLHGVSALLSKSTAVLGERR